MTSSKKSNKSKHQNQNVPRTPPHAATLVMLTTLFICAELIIPASAAGSEPYWTVTSGSCRIDVSDEKCIASPGYPGNYGNDQRCAFKPNLTGALSVDRFDTESGYDKVYIAGKVFQGTFSPNGLAVDPTTWINFATDGSSVRSGFHMCLPERTSSCPSCGGNPTPARNTTTVLQPPSNTAYCACACCHGFNCEKEILGYHAVSSCDGATCSRNCADEHFACVEPSNGSYSISTQCLLGNDDSSSAGKGSLVPLILIGLAILALICFKRWRDKKTKQSGGIIHRANGANNSGSNTNLPPQGGVVTRAVPSGGVAIPGGTAAPIDTNSSIGMPACLSKLKDPGAGFIGAGSKVQVVHIVVAGAILSIIAGFANMSEYKDVEETARLLGLEAATKYLMQLFHKNAKIVFIPLIIGSWIFIGYGYKFFKFILMFLGFVIFFGIGFATGGGLEWLAGSYINEHAESYAGTEGAFSYDGVDTDDARNKAFVTAFLLGCTGAFLFICMYFVAIFCMGCCCGMATFMLIVAAVAAKSIVDASTNSDDAVENVMSGTDQALSVTDTLQQLSTVILILDLLAGLLMGWVFIKFQKLMIIIKTSFFGGYVTVFTIHNICGLTPTFGVGPYVGSIFLGLIGFYLQFFHTGKGRYDPKTGQVITVKNGTMGGSAHAPGAFSNNVRVPNQMELMVSAPATSVSRPVCYANSGTVYSVPVQPSNAAKMFSGGSHHEQPPQVPPRAVITSAITSSPHEQPPRVPQRADTTTSSHYEQPPRAPPRAASTSSS